MTDELIVNNSYTRKEIWNYFHPNKPWPNGGPWTTGYTNVDNHLIAFANIGTSGRTGHDFPNEYNFSSKNMTWFGKPNAHSEQPTFKRLFDGLDSLLMFGRWDNKDTYFNFLGFPKITSYEDRVRLKDETITIRLELSFEKIIKPAKPMRNNMKHSLV